VCLQQLRADTDCDENYSENVQINNLHCTLYRQQTFTVNKNDVKTEACAVRNEVAANANLHILTYINRKPLWAAGQCGPPSPTLAPSVQMQTMSACMVSQNSASLLSNSATHSSAGMDPFTRIKPRLQNVPLSA